MEVFSLEDTLKQGITVVVSSSPGTRDGEIGDLLSALSRVKGALSEPRRRELHALIGDLLDVEPVTANSLPQADNSETGCITPRVDAGDEHLEEVMPTAYVSTDSNGVIRNANQTAAILFNRTPGRLTGKDIARLVVNDDRGCLRTVMNRVVRGGAMRQLEVAIKPFRLAPVPVALTVATASRRQGQANTLRWWLHDITDRRRAEDELRKSEAELRMITSRMPSCVWTTDAALRIQHAVGAGHGPIGPYSCIHIGLTLYEIFGADAAACETIAAHERALAGDAAACEIDLEDRAFEVRVEPLRDSANRIGGCIGLAVDITERKRAQEKLRLLQAELAHAGRLGILGGMAASMAHELNQPLTAIVAYTQACVRLLRSGKGTLDDMVATMEQVADQGLRAGRIIRRMKAISHTRKARVRSVDVNALVTEVVSLMDWEANRNRVVIRRELAGDLPEVMVDATAVTQVLLNLLRNAIQALEGSEGERTIALRTGAQASGHIEVSITDSGPGLPGEYLERLFEPFFSTKPDGVGMGLPISQSLIEGQGGRLWVVPHAAGGASFRFSLPVNAGSYP